MDYNKDSLSPTSHTKKGGSTKETIIFLITILIIFGYPASVMGMGNLFNVLMYTAHDLLINTSLFIMAIAVLAGAFSALMSEFGVVALINKLISPIMTPIYELPGAASLGAITTFLSDNPAIISLAKDREFISFFKIYQVPALCNLGTAFGMGLILCTFMFSMGDDSSFLIPVLIGFIGAFIGRIISVKLMLRETKKYYGISPSPQQSNNKTNDESVGGRIQNTISNLRSDKVKEKNTHNNKKITDTEIEAIEKEVNDIILQFIDVDSQYMTYNESQKYGAIGLFNDKYSENVRVLSVGNYSKELCGGLHVVNSGQIGSFKIVSEGSVSSGTRRIEAVTGDEVLKKLIEDNLYFKNIGNEFKIDEKQVRAKIPAMLREGNEVKIELSNLKKEYAKQDIDEKEILNIDGVKLFTKKFNNQEINFLREYIDDLNKQYSDIVVLLANITGDKVSYLLSVHDTLTAKGMNAGKLFKEISEAGDAKGGGKANMAQGGSQNTNLVDKIFEVIADKISL